MHGILFNRYETEMFLISTVGTLYQYLTIFLNSPSNANSVVNHLMLSVIHNDTMISISAQLQICTLTRLLSGGKSLSTEGFSGGEGFSVMSVTGVNVLCGMTPEIV